MVKIVRITFRTVNATIVTYEQFQMIFLVDPCKNFLVSATEVSPKEMGQKRSN